MKKSKLLALLSLGLLTFSIAACDVQDLTSFITQGESTTEISNVKTTEEVETEDIIEIIEDEVVDTVTEDTEVEEKTDEKETGDVLVTDDVTDTVITNKYELLAESLYQYEQDYEELYGYQQLGNDTRYGSLMQDVYETFYVDAHKFLGSADDYEVYESSSFNYIIIGEYEYSSSKYTDIIASAWITFIEENPIYYFTYTGYTIKTNGSGHDKTYSFCFLGGTDYAKADDRYEANLAVLDMLTDFSDRYEALEEKDDYSVAKMIHDYICNKIEYAYDSEGNASEEYWAHNILGVAMKGSGVCECYAETYLLLSYLTDLDCLIVLGESGGGGHVWNYVSIDGVWYGLDATWDDGDEIIYDYFLVSSKIMNKAHQANDSSYYGIDYQVDLPTLSTTSYDTSLDDNTTNVPSVPVYPPYVGPMNPWRRW